MTNALSPLVLLLATLSPAASGDDPLPGRDGSYQFEGVSIEGTVWQGVFWPNDKVILRFERGGVLWYRYPGGVSREGSWKQNGNAIYLETVNKYAEYHAVLRGDRLIGSASNVTKLKWTFEMKRQPASMAKD